MSVAYPPKEERLLNHTMSIPPDLVRWWRRVTTMERGKLHSIAIVVPSDESGKVTWGVVASVKLENE